MPETAPRPKNRKQNRFIKQLKTIVLILKLRLARFGRWVKRRANRGTSANILMFCFIIFTSIGAGMIFPPAGWVVAGVACGMFGFLLGAE